MIKILQVVPSDTKNDLLMDLLDATLIDQTSVHVLMLEPGTGELSSFCISRSIGYSILKQKKNMLLQILSAHSYIRKVAPDRIFFQSFMPCFIGAFLSFSPYLRFSTTVAVRHHNVNHHILKNRKAIIADKFISRRADRIFAVSQSVRNTLLSEGCNPKKVIVVENGLNPMRYGFIPPKTRFYDHTLSLEMVAVGRLDWQKNYDLMFKIVQVLKNRGLNFNLTIFGTGRQAEFQRLNRLICELEIGNYVKWGGWIPNIELAYNNAHLLLHTALDEACPLVLIEAQLAGLPLVSTTLGGSQDIVGSHYGAISGKNPEEYCNRIVEIAGDYDSFLFRSVQDIGVAIERFSTEKMASFYTTSFDHF